MDGGLIVFDEVPSAIAAVLCVAAGQPHPDVGEKLSFRARKTEENHGQSV
jgi:hypothetical protein